MISGVGGILDTQPKNQDLPPLKPDDMQYFDKLLMDVDESEIFDSPPGFLFFSLPVSMQHH